MEDILRSLATRVRQLANPVLIASVAVLTLAAGLGAQSDQSPKDKTAGEYYKNIQVLKSVPASDLLPGMRYITTALGVKCDYCHVNPFAKDAKPEKETARKMMTMLTAINANNFSGRPEVSCYTCHQGHSQPMGVPTLTAEAVAPQFIRPAEGAQPPALPAADAVLDKFAEAAGADAAGKIATREIQGEETVGAQTFTVDVHEKAPNQMYAAITTPQGQMTSGFDGTHGWMATNRGVQSGTEIEDIVRGRQAQIDPATALKNYTDKRIRGEAKIGDATTYVMQAKAPDGVIELLFFDEQSGLLVRRMIRDRTIFGALPIEADYSDYRDVDGAKVPYKTTWYTAGQSAAYTVKDIKNNAPVDDSKFEMPAKQQ